LLSSLLLAGLLVGCSTVVPQTPVNNTASYDGDQQNSGFVGFVTNNNVVFGVVTMHSKDRYNNLIEVYGSKVIHPPIPKNYGLQDNKTNCWLTLEALVDYMKMNVQLKKDTHP